ncbi:LptA/OstA family protein [Caenispirillum bisanense]|uniref:LptA/OstA family protein n=1 Tax=Caenispirillum bisanense TaxID=414052 RepID=UPI0031DE636A
MQVRMRAAVTALALGLGLMAGGVVVVADGAPAAAQTLNLATGGSGGGQGAAPVPIEVLADDGIEWLQDERRFIARGNAVATRGTTQVLADRLIADYRELPEEQGGGTQVFRLTAEGNVTIRSPQETATGTRSIYDVDAAILYLWGGPAKLVTPTDMVSATKEIRYYERDRKAVAEGDAVAVRGDRRINADVLTAFFVDPEAAPRKQPAKAAANANANDSLAGGSELERIYADGNVVITTSKERIEARQGNYNAKTGIAEMEGSVKITQGKSVLQGDRATSNLNTHVSTLHSGAGGMARGLLVPKTQEGRGGAGGSN